MKTPYTHQKDDLILNENFEKSELMQLFESEIHHPFIAQLELINAILATD